jgi:hypothetical protein
MVPGCRQASAGVCENKITPLVAAAGEHICTESTRMSPSLVILRWPGLPSTPRYPSTGAGERHYRYGG